MFDPRGVFAAERFYSPTPDQTDLAVDHKRAKSITIGPVNPTARLSLRGARAEPLPVFKAVAKSLGFQLPPKMLMATVAEKGLAQGFAALWLAPDELYVMSENRALGEALVALAQPANAVVRDGAAVDQSHRFCGILVEGTGAMALIQAQCPQDLSDAAFPIGKATRTLYGKVEIVLWRIDENRYRLEFGRSFTGYVSELLATVRRDLLSL